MIKEIGSKIWVFPDGELPPAGNFSIKGHESVIILNPNDKYAEIVMELFFEEDPPPPQIVISVPPKRVRCIRMDDPNQLCGYKLEREKQYSIILQSDIPIVAQYGRLDTREQPMAFYTTSGYSQ